MNRAKVYVPGNSNSLILQPHLEIIMTTYKTSSKHWLEWINRYIICNNRVVAEAGIT